MPDIRLADTIGNRSYTSIRLEWMKAIMFSGLSPLDKCVAVIIMNCINDKTHCWKISDETIAALLGGKHSERAIRRSRMRLKAGGWLTWKRTRDANVYTLCHGNTMDALDEIMRQRMERKQRRDKRRSDRTPVAGLDRTPVSDRHTRRTYSEKTVPHEEVRHDLAWLSELRE
jgi:hypothetical protein